LKHDRAIGSRPVDRFSSDSHRSRRRKLQARGHPQARRLAASGRTNDCDELLCAYLEAHFIDRGHLLAIASEASPYAVEHDIAHCGRRTIFAAAARPSWRSLKARAP